MLAFWALMVLFGYLDILFGNSEYWNEYSVTSMLICTAAIFLWFLEDAKEIGKKPTIALKIGVVVAAIIAIPYYLLRYKGWRRSVASFAKFAGFTLMLIGYEYGLEYFLHRSA